MTTRPAVSVTTVYSPSMDITHCVVAVGDFTYEAHFHESSSELIANVEEATGIVLTTEEVMKVTGASRHQMEREADRLNEALANLPAGSVVRLPSVSMYFWRGSEGRLLWMQYLPSIGEDLTEIFTYDIEGVGEVDTDELHEVTCGIRDAMASLTVETHNAEWLLNLEGVFPRDPRIDPRKGDKLRDETGRLMTVDAFYSLPQRPKQKQVSYTAQPGGHGCVCGLTNWRRFYKRAEVMHVEPGIDA